MFKRHIKEGRDIGFAVVLRPLEYSIYAKYDAVPRYLGCIWGLVARSARKAAEAIKDRYLRLRFGERETALGTVVPNIDYYLIDGRVKIKRYVNKGGEYRYINGIPVKVRENSYLEKNSEHIVQDCLQMVEANAELQQKKQQEATDLEVMANARRGSLGNKAWFHRDDPAMERLGV